MNEFKDGVIDGLVLICWKQCYYNFYECQNFLKDTFRDVTSD